MAGYGHGLARGEGEGGVTGGACICKPDEGNTILFEVVSNKPQALSFIKLQCNSLLKLLPYTNSVL